MYRPIGRYRRLKRRKSTTSLNVTRRLLYVYFRTRRIFLCAKVAPNERGIRLCLSAFISAVRKTVSDEKQSDQCWLLTIGLAVFMQWVRHTTVWCAEIDGRHIARVNMPRYAYVRRAVKMLQRYLLLLNDCLIELLGSNSNFDLLWICCGLIV